MNETSDKGHEKFHADDVNSYNISDWLDQNSNNSDRIHMTAPSMFASFFQVKVTG